MSVKFTRMSQFIAAAEKWISANTAVPREQGSALVRIGQQLVQSGPDRPPAIISLAGAPGTGKSTLAYACCAGLQADRRSALVLSLDDYYYPAEHRRLLARTEHPLFGVRGAPGTHDIDLLTDHVSQLLDPSHGEIHVPRFDKSSDDRMVDSRTVAAGFVPDALIIEGWIAGVPPQAGGGLLRPVNTLEALDDEDGEWRARVNACLYDYHQSLGGLVNRRCYLKAPDWTSVIRWRLQQEKDSGSKLLTDQEQVGNFLAHYERLCTHMDDTCHEWSDIIVELDEAHFPTILET